MRARSEWRENFEGPNQAADCLGVFRSKALRTALSRIPPTLMAETPEQLERLARPTATDRRLRNRLWTLAGLSIHRRERFKLRELHSGICSYTHFYVGVLGHPEKLAWLITPDALAKRDLVEVQRDAVSRLREILSAPVLKKNGRLNATAAAKVLEGIELAFSLEFQNRRFLGKL